MLTEKEKGSLLANRLKVLNNFLIQDKTDSFAEYLHGQRIGKNDFISNLPEDLRDVPTSREEIMEYAKYMNAVYSGLYLDHVLKTRHNADGHKCCDDCQENADGTGRAKIRCSTMYPPPRTRKRTKDAYAECVRKTAAQIAKNDEAKDTTEKKGKHNINKFNPVFVLMRSAFLSLLKLNIASLASVLNHMRNQNGSSWKKLQIKWYNLGGDKDALNNSIASGRTKKPFPKFKKRKGHADGEEEELNAEDPKQAGKVALAAGGALGGLAGVLALDPLTAPAVPYVGAGGAMLAVISPLLKEFARSKGEDTSAVADLLLPGGTDPDVESEVKEPVDVAPDKPGSPDADESFWDKYKTPIIISLSVASLVGTVIAFISFSKKAA